MNEVEFDDTEILRKADMSLNLKWFDKILIIHLSYTNHSNNQ